MVAQGLFYQNGWRISPQIVTREGKIVITSGDTWHLPISTQDSASIRFGKILNVNLRRALQYYVVDRLKRISTHSGFDAYKEVWRHILIPYCDSPSLNGAALKERLISIFETAISTVRAEHRLYDLYLPIKWYVYCAEHYPELGFCTVYALELECITIPGSPKGEAVRTDDPDNGPLHLSLELPLLISALKEDTSTAFEHLRQKAALGLSLAFGRNPANLTFLREEDFDDLTPDSSERCYVLKIPRIKKRLINPRDDFMQEYLEPFFAKFIIDLINKNRSVNPELYFEDQLIPNPRPLFVNTAGNRMALICEDLENAYNSTSADITGLIQAFVLRHKIISPITGLPMHVTSRRLRYTLATSLAAEGISKKELARILDHSDTQHVLVYFELGGKIVDSLDKAAAKKLSEYYDYFRGDIIASDSDAVNGNHDNKHVIYIDENAPKTAVDIGVCGKTSLCHLDPPFSCYLCPKFQAYDFADHEYVLSRLLENRDKKIQKYENARLGVQLDDVIAAVAQVCRLCNRGAV